MHSFMNISECYNSLPLNILRAYCTQGFWSCFKLPANPTYKYILQLEIQIGGNILDSISDLCQLFTLSEEIDPMTHTFSGALKFTILDLKVFQEPLYSNLLKISVI